MTENKKITIGGIIEQRDLMMISVFSVPNLPGSAGRVLNYFGKKGINVDFIIESSNSEGLADLNFCINLCHKPKIDQMFGDLAKIITIKNTKITEPVFIVSFYGPHFREKPAIAGKICQLLGEASVNILAISTSISSICCVIHNDQLSATRKAILENFDYPK